MASARDIASALSGEGNGRSAASASADSAAAARRGRRRVWLDRLATLTVRAGGFGIIASILAILIFIVVEVMPLIGGAAVTLSRVDPLPGPAVRAVVADEFGTHVAALDESGTVRVLRVADGVIAVEQALGDGAHGLVSAQVPPGTNLLTGATTDGRVLLMPVQWDAHFEAQQRVVTPSLGAHVSIEMDPAGHPVPVYTAGLASSGAAAAGQLADGSLVIVRATREENQFTGEVNEAQERFSTPVAGRLTQLVFDRQQHNLFGADATGNLLWWPLTPTGIGAAQVVPAGTTVTALSLLLGGRSLVVGQANGALSVWFVAPRDDGPARLTRVRDFPRRSAPIAAIAPSQRDKGFMAADAQGGLGLYYSTSNRTMWTGRAPFIATALALGPRGNGAYAAGDGRLAAFAEIGRASCRERV